MINIVLTLRNEIEYINTFYGMVIACKDTKEVYFVNENNQKIEITDNCVCLPTKVELYAILSPVLSRVYLVEEDLKLYTYGKDWIEVKDVKFLEDVVNRFNDYKPSLLFKDDKFYVPKTVDSSVYMTDGRTVSQAIDEYELRVTNTKALYVEAELYKQRIFAIPFPTCGYDLSKNHISIVLKGKILQSSDYIISDQNLILSTTAPVVEKGDLLLFIFYYVTILDMNDNVIISTKHIEDKSITTEKLCPSVRIKATNVVETANRYFMTDEEKSKLDGVSSNATNYTHPETHPASMIVEDDNRMFISKHKLELLDDKVCLDIVYSKQEVNDLLDRVYKEIIDSSPDALNTLKELADALGNDANFATTITNKLSNKVEISDYNIFKNEVDDRLNQKVDIVDYIKSGIFATPIKYNKGGRDVYEFTFNDTNFKDYLDGMLVVLKIANSNELNASVAINSLPPVKILAPDGLELYKNELIEGCIYTLRYNATTGNFILQGKGGVRLTGTQCEYVSIDKTPICKGDCLDIVDEHNVRKSIHRSHLISTHAGIGNDFNCSGEIKSIPINENTFINVWQDGLLLKARIIRIDSKNNLDSTIMQTPVILNTACKEFVFDVTDINRNVFVVSMITTSDDVTATIISMDINGTISIGNTYRVENPYTEATNLVGVPIGNDKYILGFETEGRSMIHYLEYDINRIDALTTRDNIDYPLDRYVKLSDGQILFVGNVGNKLYIWAMVIYSNSVLYSTKLLLDYLDRHKMLFTLVDNNTVILDYTDSLGVKMYRQRINVDYNGNIIMSEPDTIVIDVNNIRDHLNAETMRYDKDMFIGCSNYDVTKSENFDEIGDYINLSIYDNDMNRLDNLSVIPKLYSNVSLFTLNDNTIGLTYIADSKICISLFSIKKYPDAIAITGGSLGDGILINKW